MTVRWLERTAILTPYLALCLSEKAFHAALRHIHADKSTFGGKWVSDDADGTCWSLAHNDGADHQVCVVCIRRTTDTPLSAIVGIISHEARHVYETMKAFNPSIHWEEEELAAECIGQIVQRLTADLFRQLEREDKMPRKKRKKAK